MVIVAGSCAQRFSVPPWRYRLARLAEQRMSGFMPQYLANTAWTVKTIEMKLPDSRGWIAVDLETDNAALACIWYACGGQGSTVLLDSWSGQDTLGPRVPDSKELHLLTPVCARARPGDSSSV